MTSKLRRKFYLFASLSVSALLLLILGTINIVNFSLVASQADSITQNIADGGGAFPSNEPGMLVAPGNSQQGGDAKPSGQPPARPDAPDSPDMKASVRYITLQYTETGAIVMEPTHLKLIDNATASSWAEAVKGASQTGWHQTYYRFRKYTYNNASYVTFIDYARELSPSFHVLNGSIVGGLIGLAVTFLALIPLSKLLVKPTEEAWRKQKSFVSDASHELKTPLSIISANAEILELEYGENEQSQAIGRQNKTMNRLVKNLNALAQIEESGKPAFTTLDLSLIASEAISAIKTKAEARGLSLLSSIQDGITLSGYEPYIRSMLGNVLDNAAKYGQTTIEFALGKKGDRILIEVKNDASGIQEGPLDMVFERFYRSPEARASAEEGSGIGLSLVKEAVALHKGRVYARGENGFFILRIEF